MQRSSNKEGLKCFVLLKLTMTANGKFAVSNMWTHIFAEDSQVKFKVLKKFVTAFFSLFFFNNPCYFLLQGRLEYLVKWKGWAMK